VNDTAVRRLSDLTDELERNGVGKMVPLTVQGAIRPERSKWSSSTSASRLRFPGTRMSVGWIRGAPFQVPHNMSFTTGENAVGTMTLLA
jgi:hypothetical protein